MPSFESFLDNASTTSHLRVEADLGDGFVRLRSDEAERRQAAQDIRSSEDIVIELLRNARDAHAHNVYLAISSSGSKRTICTIDDGKGVPSHLHDAIFEPRVTSKLDSACKDAWGLHGRGMALFSIAQNSIEAKVCCSKPMLGSSILVRTDTHMLPEKSDQSTFPSFKFDSDNSISIRGPKNILRTACEFALEERNTMKVYCGSVAEIASTILHNAEVAIPFALRAFADDYDAAPFVFKPAYCSDAVALSRTYALIGLDVSVRTTQRIMSGEIKPQPHLIDRIASEGFSSKPSRNSRNSVKSAAIRKSIRPDEDDCMLFSESLEPALTRFCEKYYLSCNGDVECNVSNDSIKLSIPIASQDVNLL